MNHTRELNFLGDNRRKMADSYADYIMIKGRDTRDSCHTDAYHTVIFHCFHMRSHTQCLITRLSNN